MIKIKVIDLLTKIANEEEVPERIKYDTKEMKYDHNKQDYLGYYSNGNGEWLFQYLFDRCRNTEHFINDEVEIIEYDNKIEKIELTNGGLTLHKVEDEIEKDIALTSIERTIIYKLNEIIDKINKEDKK